MSRLLSFQNVSFSYGARSILHAADFDLRAGSCTALIGPNGAGKTTLLRLAAGLLQCRSGRIDLDGRAMRELPLREIARSIALVPQHLEMPFAFTVQQVVEQGRTPYLGVLRGPAHRDRVAIDRALELTDLLNFRHRIFNELSGGERQRVKIALALAQQPRLLLLDEPTQNLDIGRQAELIDLLLFLQAQGITVFASIHDLHLVRGNFSSVMLITPDMPLIIGTADEVLTADHLERAFDCAPARHSMHLDRSLLYAGEWP
jgi:ABC-type cobalamin/Fe3+-siderophores transport system ATPase subunit